MAVDSWEHRKARMQPQRSRMEMALLVRLHDANVKVETDRTFCLQSTTPDFLVAGNVAVFLDGVVHRGREDRDGQLRDLLAKRYGFRVLSIPYEGRSKREEDRVLEQIIKEAQ